MNQDSVNFCKTLCSEFCAALYTFSKDTFIKDLLQSASCVDESG